LINRLMLNPSALSWRKERAKKDIEQIRAAWSVFATSSSIRHGSCVLEQAP
jgi:hypothetical protein